MLDPKRLRNQPDEIREALKARTHDAEQVDRFLEEDESWRKLVVASDDLKKERNRLSEEIGKLKKEGKNADTKQEEVRQINDRIKTIDADLKTKEERLNDLLLYFPNVPHPSVPRGAGAADNVTVKTWENKITPSNPAPHWDLAEKLKLIDFARAAKLSGSMFALYVGLGAKLQRAIIQFMLDFHIAKHGYTEIYPPYLVKREIMVGTGQVPKFEEDMYRCDADDLFLIPTAEVPVTNMHREEILGLEELPKYYAAYTACFRREAGAAGADTRGLQRLHQFDKVELVKLTTPESSYEEHEKLLVDVEDVLQALELKYRILLLCSGDMGFSAAKCYDAEAWCPGQKKWAEVSSCSNFEDFQARRANLKFRREKQSKPEFVHTLNASGLALPRTVIAILETYQQSDHCVAIPNVLQPYMNGMKEIKINA